VKYTCGMETVQQNCRFTLFSSKFHSNIYSILFDSNPCLRKKWLSFFADIGSTDNEENEENLYIFRDEKRR